MRAGSLFTGIGGIDLGLEWAGFTTAWQVESDEYCRRVLARHWPDVPRWGDVATFPPDANREPWISGRDEPVGETEGGIAIGRDRPERVDLISAGFPCQPVSVAGSQLGQEDDRWLWPETIRIVRQLRPRYVLLENVPGLLSVDGGRLFGTVLGDLAASGFDAWWTCLSAAACGAPHIRDRVFIVGYRHADGEPTLPVDAETAGVQGDGDGGSKVPDADDPRRIQQRRGQSAIERGSGWAVEPAICRVAHGVPARVDRLRSLGNAVVPQCAEVIGRMILEMES